MSRCEFTQDDGAYVLGALAPAERAAYERHLAGCADCREAVAELAVLPGLLGRLDPAGLDQFLRPTPGPSLPALLDEARNRRHRERATGRRRYALTALVAAALALIVGLGAALVLPRQTAPPAEEPGLVAMQPVAGTVPLHAELALSATGWGTEVTVRCGYDPRPGYGRVYTFRLVAYGPDGAAEQVGSWLAAPGDSVRFTGVTRFTGAELVRLELLRADDTPVLGYDVR